MKNLKILVFLILMVVGSGVLCFGQKGKKSLKTYEDSLSYAFGIEMGKELKDNLKLEDDNFNLKVFMRGVSDYFEEEGLKMDKDSTVAFLTSYFNDKHEKEKAALIKEGEDFLAENAKREGVKVTGSGLQYEVLKSGNGDMPVASSRVKVHYTGSLIDGTSFDSSWERGEPVTFGVGQVIQGWTEALQLMHVGDKWKIFLPSELAYGERGAGEIIPPFSVLIFEVELLGIE